jgi:hypothetical protein
MATGRGLESRKIALLGVYEVENINKHRTLLCSDRYINANYLSRIHSLSQNLASHFLRLKAPSIVPKASQHHLIRQPSTHTFRVLVITLRRVDTAVTRYPAVVHSAALVITRRIQDPRIILVAVK